MATNLLHITLTGAGLQTSVDEMIAISREHPLVEWGLLFSPTRCGTEPRYAPAHWIEETLRRLAAAGCKTSVHLCGVAVLDFLGSDMGASARLARLAGRVQLNLPAHHGFSAGQIAARISRFPVPVITQQNPALEALNRQISTPNHVILFDASCGRGIAPTQWPEYWPEKSACGYAGGLSPETVAEQLRAILDLAAGRPVWIDAEGKLFDDAGAFSLEKCRAFLTAAQPFV